MRRTVRRHLRGVEILQPRQLLSALGFARHEIDLEATVVSGLLLADLDGDTDADVVAVFEQASGVTMAWYENTDGGGSFTSRRLIADVGRPVTAPSVQITDLDADGDQDVVALILFDRGKGELLWYENDGHGAFAAAQFIAGLTSELAVGHALRVADLDHDGDTDIVSFVSDAASSYVGEIAWYAQEGDKVAFGPPTRISAGVELGGLVELVDVDDDGDLDVVASYLNAPVAGGLNWFKNDGAGNFSDAASLLTYPADEVMLPTQLDVVDIDGDQHNDVVTTGAFLGLGSVDYFRQVAPDKLEHAAVLGASVATTSFIQGADLDQDGDVDIIASGIDAAVWFEQSRDPAAFADPHQIADARVFAALDLSGDGYVDLFGADPRGICWFENRIPGDADGNGEVDFGDFLTLTQNFGKSAVVWTDGDFDQDGVVAFADFLALTRNFGTHRNQALEGRAS